MREQGEQALKERANKGVNTPWIGIFSSQMVAWALEKQGLHEAASVPRERARNMTEQFLQQSEAKFGHANVQLNLMMPRRVQVGEEFEIRCDLVNVGRRRGTLIKVEGAVPLEFKVKLCPGFLQPEKWRCRDVRRRYRRVPS